MGTLRDVFGNFSRSRLLLRDLIVTTAPVAFTIGLTFMSGVAQAQIAVEDSGQALPGPGPSAQFVAQNRFFAFDCRVGPRPGDVTFRCFNLVGVSANPSNVQCQTRNSNSQPTAFRDQFACQITSTSAQAVTFRIRRIDDGADGGGWGQDLHVNLLIVN
jgi:hypothetical protein